MPHLKHPLLDGLLLGLLVSDPTRRQPRQPAPQNQGSGCMLVVALVLIVLAVVYWYVSLPVLALVAIFQVCYRGAKG